MNESLRSECSFFFSGEMQNNQCADTINKQFLKNSGDDVVDLVQHSVLIPGLKLQFALSSVCVETTTVKSSPFLFREYELVTEPEEEEVGEAGIDTTVVEEEWNARHSSIVDCKV